MGYDPRTSYSHVFIIHALDGSRVGCGKLEAPTAVVLDADLSELSDSGVSGEVTILAYSGFMFGFGTGDGLAPDLTEPSNTPNSMGVHVHAGFACTDSSTQGGHYYNSDLVSVDPWSDIRYPSTNGEGDTMFTFDV